MRSHTVVQAACFLTAASFVTAGGHRNHGSSVVVLKRDVVILGGGASGAHAAVRLSQDFNKSIVLVEKRHRLGGHVETYYDPTGTPYDYGVQSYIDYPGTKEFFAKLNVTIATPKRAVLAPKYADFRAGKTTVGYMAPNQTAVRAALTRYLEQAEKYESMLSPGYAKFPTPQLAPSELFIPFGEFSKKYDLDAAVPQMAAISGGGLNSPSTTPTMFVMQAFGAPLARAFLGLPQWAPVSRDNMELYKKIDKLLGKDIIYSSEAVSANRTAEGVEVTIKSQNGTTTVIQAKRLLVSFEPTLDSMNPLQLDKSEKDVFSKWNFVRIYVGIVRHPALPLNSTVINTPLAAAPANYLARPELPFIGRFDHMGSPGWRVIIYGNENFTRSDAIKLVQDSVDSMVKGGALPTTNSTRKAEILAFGDHGPMQLQPTVAEYKDGFIQAKNSLQGHRSTWYTGSAWVGDYYGQILRYKCASRYGMEAAANLFAFKASDLCVFVIYQGSFGVIFAGVQRALKPTSEEI